MSFTERVPAAGRPQIGPHMQVMMSEKARADLRWRSDPGLPPIDKGMLGLLSQSAPRRWVPVSGIAAAVEEHQVEVCASLSRLFSVGLVDVEGMTTRR